MIGVIFILSPAVIIFIAITVWSKQESASLERHLKEQNRHKEEMEKIKK